MPGTSAGAKAGWETRRLFKQWRQEARAKDAAEREATAFAATGWDKHNRGDLYTWAVEVAVGASEGATLRSKLEFHEKFPDLRRALWLK